MNFKVLHDRLESLGWKPYRVAKEIDKLRGTNKGAGNYTSTVKKILEHPEKSQSKTLEDMITVMGGELFIKWKKVETVVVDYEEVKLSD